MTTKQQSDEQIEKRIRTQHDHDSGSQRQDVESAPALLPCPFCGSAALVRLEDQSDTPGDWWYVDCSRCPVQTYPQTTTAEASRVWNTRANSYEALLSALKPFADEAVSEMGFCHAGITTMESCIRCGPILKARAAISLATGGQKDEESS